MPRPTKRTSAGQAETTNASLSGLEGAGYDPVTLANESPVQYNVNQGASPAMAEVAPCNERHYDFV